MSLTVPDGVTLPDGVSVDGDKDEATGTILDDDALTVSVAGPDANVEEGQTATFTVTVTGTSTEAVVVSYEVDTVVSTATATDDYTAPSGTVLTIGGWGGEWDDRDSDAHRHRCWSRTRRWC